jgi:hypothetical protein
MFLNYGDLPANIAFYFNTFYTVFINYIKFILLPLRGSSVSGMYVNLLNLKTY